MTNICSADFLAPYATLTSADCEGVAEFPHSAVLSLYVEPEETVPSTSEMAVECYVVKSILRCIKTGH